MILNLIKNLIKYLSEKPSEADLDVHNLEKFVNNKKFMLLLNHLLENDPYDHKYSYQFSKQNVITALPHLRVLKTSLNLSTSHFFLEFSNLLKPFNEKFSNKFRKISDDISNKNFGRVKLISNLLKTSKSNYFKSRFKNYEKTNPFALYPTSSFRNSNGNVVSSNDYQNIDATMSLNTFTSIKVVENSLEISNRLLSDNYKSFGRCICLIDKNVETNFGNKISKYFDYHKIKLKKLIYRAMEVDKHIGTVEKIVEDFRKLGVKRNEPVLIVGGGVIGDIGAFASSIYHRSTPYIMLATSVVSAIDSGPSPRSCCDAGGFKNLLGSFHAPVLNITDRSFFKTLKTSWVRHGIAEIHKMAVIRDKELFFTLEDVGIDLMKTHFGTVNCKNKVDIIKKSKKILGLSLKSYVESEYDNLHEVHSLRDHAFGHGLSANFELKSGMLHGHAISVEMCLTTFISYKLGWLSEIEMYRIFKLFSSYELSLWHDILKDNDCMIEGYEKILQKRGGNLAIPVPIGIGKSGYINDLSKKQLLDYIDEYETVVTKYPRNGKGIEPLCVDAGLEEPLAIYNSKKNNFVSAKIN